MSAKTTVVHTLAEALGLLGKNEDKSTQEKVKINTINPKSISIG